MKKKRIVLVGLLALHNKIDHTYSINSVSKSKTRSGKIDILTQLGIDLKLYIPFKQVVHALCDLYAGAVINVWRADNRACTKVYLQMHRLGQPGNVGLDGEFVWWAQR